MPLPLILTRFFPPAVAPLPPLSHLCFFKVCIAPCRITMTKIRSVAQHSPTEWVFSPLCHL
ncbi:hypothetical protein ATPR_1416 [Acetobacter tropicalis NBRC 101654]|uniref:Uncharacterized protein n=1 Tax=Acetobacter tropicalis NBRC 101654 TaxID=749388 RepID=F7VDG7_9PROT|nr:hypothetical protein ATPR_1416 [Acetobacter tropicalis NBRC 101654]